MSLSIAGGGGGTNILSIGGGGRGTNGKIMLSFIGGGGGGGGGGGKKDPDDCVGGVGKVDSAGNGGGTGGNVGGSGGNVKGVTGNVETVTGNVEGVTGNVGNAEVDVGNAEGDVETVTGNVDNAGGDVGRMFISGVVIIEPILDACFWDGYTLTVLASGIGCVNSIVVNSLNNWFSSDSSTRYNLYISKNCFTSVSMLDISCSIIKRLSISSKGSL